MSLELKQLLSPITVENPSGSNLKYTGLYDEIREARRQEEDLEQGEWKRELKVAHWEKVQSLCFDALKLNSKDIQLCAWLAEALMKTEGFRGLNESLKLLSGIHKSFWDSFYPQIDEEDDYEARCNTLSYLDRQIGLAIKEIPLTRSISGLQYSYVQWEQSREFEIPENQEGLSYEERQRVIELKSRAEEEHKITTEQWRSAKNGTPRAFYETTLAQMEECREELNLLYDTLNELYTDQAPGLGSLKNSLDEVYSLVKRITEEKRLLEPDTVTTEQKSSLELTQETNQTFYSNTGVVKSRQEALQKLSEVAEYFRKTEPHSPVSYLVNRAIKWGNMPLDEWLKDVIKNDGVLDNLRETLGFNTNNGN
jgi:type VI secretion system protein ImpA